jgi:hypothetical protein
MKDTRVTKLIDAEHDIVVTAVGTYVQYVPAKINADPNDCHEAEGGFVEDVELWIQYTVDKITYNVRMPNLLEELNSCIPFGGSLSEGLEELMVEEYKENNNGHL